jgi:hypothetical protein
MALEIKYDPNTGRLANQDTVNPVAASQLNPRTVVPDATPTPQQQATTYTTSSNTLVIAVGTNDAGAGLGYNQTYNNVNQIIQNGINQGYSNIVVIPPNPALDNYSRYQTVRSAAYSTGNQNVTFLDEDYINSKGGWIPSDPDHLRSNTVTAIGGEYPNATYLGDSNAGLFRDNGTLPNNPNIFGYKNQSSGFVETIFGDHISIGNFPKGGSPNNNGNQQTQPSGGQSSDVPSSSGPDDGTDADKSNPDPSTPSEINKKVAKDAAAAQAKYKAFPFTPKSTEELEAVLLKAGGINKSQLIWLYKHVCRKNDNQYYLLLNFLVYGFDAKVMVAFINTKQNKAVADKPFIQRILKLKTDPYASTFILNTPAGKKGAFDDIKSQGLVQSVNAQNTVTSPITGPGQHTPSLVERLLNDIHPDAVKNIENLCNKIRTHSWLSLPLDHMNSLMQIVGGIQKSIELFQDMIHDLYQGAMNIIKKYYQMVVGMIAQLQQQILSYINTIIDLDFLCLILEAITVLLSDIQFVGSLFNMNAGFLNYLNQFQNYLNIGSQFIFNPLGAITSLMPPQVQNIISMVNQIGTNPEGFLASKFSNYGYGYILQALQGNLVGAIISKYGANQAMNSPLGSIVSKSLAIYTHFGGKLPNLNPVLTPNQYVNSQGYALDANGHPMNYQALVGQKSVSDIATQIFQDQYNQTSTQLQNDAQALGDSLNQVGTGFKNLGTDISNGFNSLGRGVSNAFNTVTGKNKNEE